MQGIVLALGNGQCQHVVEMGIEEYLVFVHRHNIMAMDEHHVVPDVHFLTQETLQDAVGEEHALQVEIRTDHHIGHRDVLRYNGYLVFVQFHLYAIHLGLHLATGADNDGIHRHMGGIDLGELLDAVDHDDVIVRIANLDVLIVG